VPDFSPAFTTPYQALLGGTYRQLHAHVRAAHETICAEGRVTVVHGTHVLTPFFVRAMNLPAPGNLQPTTLRVTIDRASHAGDEPRMTWTRQIGDTRLDTRQFARGGRLVEVSGAGSIAFTLRVNGGALFYEHSRSRLFAVPLPQALVPDVSACVSPLENGWRVRVLIEWQGHLVCEYSGDIHPAGAL